MKIMKKYLITAALTLGLLVVGTTTAQVKTHWGFSETGTINVTAEAWFNPSIKVPSGTSLDGLKANSYVKQAWVRIVEGSYDSGRAYTAVAPASKPNKEYSVKITRVNNPFADLKSSNGWLYY